MTDNMNSLRFLSQSTRDAHTQKKRPLQLVRVRIRVKDWGQGSELGSGVGVRGQG